MVLTRAQRRKLLGDGELPSITKTDQSNTLREPDSKTAAGLDALLDSKPDAGVKEVHSGHGTAQLGEQDACNDILHLVVVEVRDFNHCVEVPHFEDGVPEWADRFYDEHGRYSQQYLGSDGNHWDAEVCWGELSSVSVGDHCQDTGSQGHRSVVEVVELSDDE